MILKKHRYTATCICDYCGKEFRRNYNLVTRRNKKHQFCDRKCFDRWQKGENHIHFGKRGKNAPSWKGGRVEIGTGYLRVYYPNHPNINHMLYILEHRLIMEKHLGRYLNLDEVVHHINGVKDDNRIENLMLFKNDIEHRHFHKIEREKNVCAQFTTKQ